MSAFDPSDPFDSGQPWQSVPSTQPVWPTLVDHEPTATTTHTYTSSSTSVSAAVQPVSSPAPAIAPAIAPAVSPAPTAASSTTHTISDAVSSLFHRHPQETSAPAPAEGSSSTSASTPAQGQPQAHAQAPTQKPKKGALLADEVEDHPPSYESSVVRNIPQIHDNYDHLRGPPSQRGQDIKTRIPLDSTPAEHFQGGAAASGSGSGSGAASGSQVRNQYGAATQSTTPPANSSSTTSSKTVTATTTAATRLQGQTSHGRNDDDAQHSRDVDRLLGPNSHTEQEEDEEPKTHWSIVGDRKAWTAFFYIIFMLVPLSLVFFVWSMATLIISAVSMIFPPVGYFVVIAAVTSWRALGRLDLVLLKALVPKDVRERHPYLTFDIFVKPGTEECAHHGIHAAPSTSSSSTPGPTSSEDDTYTTAEGEIRQRRKKPRNVFDKSASHLSASFSNKHTLKTLSYLMIWKLVLAVPVFVIVAVFTLLTIPLIFCMLPSMLIISRAFVHWQFRWAVMWLAEKSKPISLP